MTKMILLLTRRADLSPAQFRHYWHETHRPLLLGLPGLRGLVLNEVLPDPTDPRERPDGVAEAWYESTAAMQAAMASPAAQRVITDVPNFLDAAKLQILVVAEAVELPPLSAPMLVGVA
jgi:uncharacterized protein (TIGR02118 family)